MRETIIKLPFPLPTWNILLAMNHWERKAVRDLIHQAVDVVARNRSLALWDEAKYMKLIRPKPKKRT